MTNTNTYKKLISIKKELNNCITFKDTILQNELDKKLTKIDELYNKTIELNCDYILSRSNYKVLKTIDRYNKKKEKTNNENKFNRGFIETI